MAKSFDEDAGECPECGGNWKGEEIPEKDRECFGDRTHFSLVIGVEDPRIYDGVSWWMCPHCRQMWDRFTGEKTDKRVEIKN